MEMMGKNLVRDRLIVLTVNLFGGVYVGRQRCERLPCLDGSSRYPVK